MGTGQGPRATDGGDRRRRQAPHSLHYWNSAWNRRNDHRTGAKLDRDWQSARKVRTYTRGNNSKLPGQAGDTDGLGAGARRDRDGPRDRHRAPDSRRRDEPAGPAQSLAARDRIVPRRRAQRLGRHLTAVEGLRKPGSTLAPSRKTRPTLRRERL